MISSARRILSSIWLWLKKKFCSKSDCLQNSSSESVLSVTVVVAPTREDTNQDMSYNNAIVPSIEVNTDIVEETNTKEIFMQSRFSNRHHSCIQGLGPACIMCHRLFYRRFFCNSKYTKAMARKRLFDQAQTIDAIIQIEPQSTYHFHHFTGYNQMQEGNGNLFHLPLSKSVYQKVDDGSHKSYSLHSVRSSMTVSDISRCYGCIQFVERKLRTLSTATKKTHGYLSDANLATYQELLELMFNADETCAISGIKGLWISGSGGIYHSLYCFSLDHIVPLSQGGTSKVENLQVMLQCINHVKSSQSNEETLAWFQSLKQAYLELTSSKL